MTQWILKLIFALWLVKETKDLLFWLYLWQLKEYRWRRFTAHFITSKGKSILKDKKQWLKLLLLLLLFGPDPVFYGAVGMLILIYLAEVAKVFLDLFRKNLKTPAMTAKTWLLVGLVAVTEVLFGAFSLIYFGPLLFFVALVAFDLLTPLVVILLLWFVKPLVKLAKKRIYYKARKKRKGLDELLVIGITGSYGKTSTKEFLAEILSEKFNVVRTSEHVNTEIGVAQTVLEDVEDEHEIFVAEVGAYRKG